MGEREDGGVAASVWGLAQVSTLDLAHPGWPVPLRINPEMRDLSSLRAVKMCH